MRSTCFSGVVRCEERARDLSVKRAIEPAVDVLVDGVAAVCERTKDRCFLATSMPLVSQPAVIQAAAWMWESVLLHHAWCLRAELGNQVP